MKPIAGFLNEKKMRVKNFWHTDIQEGRKRV